MCFSNYFQPVTKYHLVCVVVISARIPYAQISDCLFKTPSSLLSKKTFICIIITLKFDYLGGQMCSKQLKMWPQENWIFWPIKCTEETRKLQNSFKVCISKNSISTFSGFVKQQNSKSLSASLVAGLWIQTVSCNGW